MLNIQVGYAKLDMPDTFTKVLLALVPWVILLKIVNIINVFEMAKDPRQVLHFKINKASEVGFC